MTVHDVLARLPGYRAVGPAAWFARCPCHQEKTGSLSVRVAPGSPPFTCRCFGCGAGTKAVLAALGLSLDGTDGPVAAPAPDPEEGTGAWYELAHHLAVEQDRQARGRRGGWWGQVMTEAAELHRSLLDRIDDLDRAARRLGPDDPATWALLDQASFLESERRWLEVAMDRRP